MFNNNVYNRGRQNENKTFRFRSAIHWARNGEASGASKTRGRIAADSFYGVILYINRSFPSLLGGTNKIKGTTDHILFLLKSPTPIVYIYTYIHIYIYDIDTISYRFIVNTTPSKVISTIGFYCVVKKKEGIWMPNLYSSALSLSPTKNRHRKPGLVCFRNAQQDV